MAAPIEGESAGAGPAGAHGSLRRRLDARLPALLWIAFAVQLVVLARTAFDGFAWELETRRVLLSEEPVPVPARRFLAAHRDLNRIAAAIPLDASVLLIDSSAIPIQYSFYFRPRPFVSLLDASREDLEIVRELRPDLVVHAERRVERFEARDRLLRPERLASELARNDFLVFYPLEIPLDAPGWRLELVAREGRGSLYRIAPADGSTVSDEGAPR